MTASQMLIFAILVATMALFLWGRFRHDMVALAALMACVVAGLVPAAEAFAGFGHPAVITVACVLVLSRGLQNTGAVDWIARAVLPREAGRLTSMAALMALGAALSGFMNNVGAMALLMPVEVQLAGRLDLTPGQVLMPLAFGTILGGMTTLVGTPPNLIVSGFRAEAGLGHFAMFDFAPVGVAVALAGVAFVVLIGWRLVPARKAAGGEDFDTGPYLTEVRVPENSKAVGLTLRGFEREIEDSGAQVVGLVRNEVCMTAPHGGRRIHAGDILVLEADVDARPRRCRCSASNWRSRAHLRRVRRTARTPGARPTGTTTARRTTRVPARRTTRNVPSATRISCCANSPCCRARRWWGGRRASCGCAPATG